MKTAAAQHPRPGPRSLGFGLGLRSAHYQDIVSGSPRIDWFEALSENYMAPGGRPLHWLGRIRERYPVVLHGVSMSIGSADPVDREYLKQLKSLAERIEPEWISDHLCWTGVDKRNLHDLMPLPYTDEAVRHVAHKVRQVQDALGRRILLENVSSYVTYRESALDEWDFLAAIAEEADCLILLDINNIHVSAFNHGFDPHAYLDRIPVGRVQQFHLAGHDHCGTHIIDTHDAPVAEPVWQLYAAALRRFGPVATMIERDDNIPPLGELVDELDHARRTAADVLALPVAA